MYCMPESPVSYVVYINAKKIQEQSFIKLLPAQDQNVSQPTESMNKLNKCHISHCDPCCHGGHLRLEQQDCFRL